MRRGAGVRRRGSAQKGRKWPIGYSSGCARAIRSGVPCLNWFPSGSAAARCWPGRWAGAGRRPAGFGGRSPCPRSIGCRRPARSSCATCRWRGSRTGWRSAAAPVRPPRWSSWRARIPAGCCRCAGACIRWGAETSTSASTIRGSRGCTRCSGCRRPPSCSATRDPPTVSGWAGQGSANGGCCSGSASRPAAAPLRCWPRSLARPVAALGPCSPSRSTDGNRRRTPAPCCWGRSPRWRWAPGST